MARWRTLHEISSVAFVLVRHGEPLAARYVDHQVVESFRAANNYQECCERLGCERLSDNEYLAFKNDRDQLLQRYEKSFKNDNGWAAKVVDNDRPKFRDIEKAAGIDHLRTHYQMASHNVHANPNGVFFRLGLLHESDILLAGCSNAGLADPGHCCAISLLHTTAALCTIQPNLDSIVALKILQALADEIGSMFFEAHQQLVSNSGQQSNNQTTPPGLTISNENE
jgi:hypothetical protein